MARRAVLKTNQQLQRVCKLWQKRLKLLDWTLTAEFADLEGEDDIGESGWDTDRRVAWVRISSKIHETDDDIEETVVHEMLHVKKDGHHTYPGRDTHEEIFLNDTAAALVAAYRGKKVA